MLCNKSSQDSLFVGAGVSLSCCVMSVVSAAPDTSRLEYQLGDLSVAFFFSKVPLSLIKNWGQPVLKIVNRFALTLC
jgi:hypothetical protein